MIYDTKIDNKERAANFCSTNVDVTMTNICMGDKCSIPGPMADSIECTDKSGIGSIHTHPGLGVEYGMMSGDDILYAITKGYKFSCIGYRGLAKTVDCYNYPYGIPKEEADKFKNMDFKTRERKFLDNINKYGINIKGVRKRKPDTPEQLWNKLRIEAKVLTESKNNMLKYVDRDDVVKERFKDFCSIFLAPLEEEYLD